MANFAESDASKIAVGQPATVTLSALTDTEVSGVVTAVSPTSSVVSNVVTYPVTVVLTNPPSTVKQGMTAQVAVIVQTATNVLQLPSAAITTTGSVSTVKVLDADGTQKTTPVTLGLVGTHLHRDLERSDRRAEGCRAHGERERIVRDSSPVSGGFPGGGGGGFGEGHRDRPDRRRPRRRPRSTERVARPAPAGTHVIALADIVKRYQMGGHDVFATRGVSLVVPRGEFVAIMGASGSGKSTLMNIIGCLDVPTSGHYRLDGVNIRDLDDASCPGSGIGRSDSSFRDSTSCRGCRRVQNVELPMAYAGLKAKDRRARAEAALNTVGLADRMGHFPSEMSGGQQQRVAIARAIATNPALILADEPTGKPRHDVHDRRDDHVRRPP